MIVAREPTGSPWEAYTWRPVEAVFPPLEVRTAGWQAIRETAEQALYYAGVSAIELHRKEAPGYWDNLASQTPALYVVLRRTEDPHQPLVLHLVTASPTEVQAYGDGGDEIIGSVPMPEGVAGRVAAFASEHTVDEPFVKRRREGHREETGEQFGQEPIFESRRRQGGTGSGETPS